MWCVSAPPKEGKRRSNPQRRGQTGLIKGLSFVRMRSSLLSRLVLPRMDTCLYLLNRKKRFVTALSVFFLLSNFCFIHHPSIVSGFFINFSSAVHSCLHAAGMRTDHARIVSSNSNQFTLDSSKGSPKVKFIKSKYKLVGSLKAYILTRFYGVYRADTQKKLPRSQHLFSYSIHAPPVLA